MIKPIYNLYRDVKQEIIFQLIAITFTMFSLWGCQKYDTNVKYDHKIYNLPREDLLAAGSDDAQTLTFDNNESFPFLKEINTEYALLQKMEDIIHLMPPFIPEKRSSLENRLRAIAMVSTGLAMSAAAAIICYNYFYNSEEFLDSEKSCFEHFKNTTDGYSCQIKYRSYADVQKELSQDGGYARVVAQSRSMTMDGYNQCGALKAHGKTLVDCYYKCKDYFNQANGLNFIRWMYGSSAALGSTALGCLGWQAFQGESVVKNQKTRELLDLRQETLQAYQQIKACGKSINFEMQLIKSARASLEKFVGKVTEALHDLLKYRKELVSEELIKEVRDLQKYLAQLVSGYANATQQLTSCSQHLDKLCSMAPFARVSSNATKQMEEIPLSIIVSSDSREEAGGRLSNVS